MDYSGLPKSLQMAATLTAISKAYGTNGLDEHRPHRRRPLPAIKQDDVASPAVASGRHTKKLLKQADQVIGERSPARNGKRVKNNGSVLEGITSNMYASMNAPLNLAHPTTPPSNAGGINDSSSLLNNDDGVVFRAVHGTKTSMSTLIRPAQDRTGVSRDKELFQQRFASVRLSSTIGGTTNVSSSERKCFPRQSNFSLDQPVNELGSTTTSHRKELSSINQVRKTSKLLETGVQKLHNRIRMLQLEEDKALKKIEETRRKAKGILEIRSNRQQKLTERAHTPEEQPQTSLFFERNEHHKRLRHERVSLFLQKRREDASIVKKERKVLTRRKIKIEKEHIKMNILKRVEIQDKVREGLEKTERFKRTRLENFLKEKEREMLEEHKRMRKKEKEARELELMEAGILQRLKSTHQQQKEAVTEVERILKASQVSVPPAVRQSGVLSHDTLLAISGATRTVTPGKKRRRDA